VPWSGFGHYLTSRPSFTFDPLFHAGCYYVQEASSMFLEQVLKQNMDLSQPLKVLDLSAAPGGKSTHLQSLLNSESLLVSNEVIRSRANVLKDNIIKWGGSNVMVTNNDPVDFARLENYFDIIVVDAPCSGSGLFRRDADAVNEWSENNVQLCSQRQQRILADVWPALKNNGLLVYATCSYSRVEDEDILDWLSKQFSIESLRLTALPGWNIVEVTGNKDVYGYRFWPHLVKGEGFFIACARKHGINTAAPAKTRHRPMNVSKSESAVLESWVDTNMHDLIKNKSTIYAWPRNLVNDFSFLLNLLHVVYSGTIIGEVVRDKLVPDHSLAMNPVILKNVLSAELNFNQAIDYLKRKDLHLDLAKKGWQLVKYEGHSLGWINALSNRINNYYPKELRILKDI
jgi:NOL1/NOP2/fmu family ribosome biogenesis protein